MRSPTAVEDVVEVPLQLTIDGSAHPYPTRTVPVRRRRRRPRPVVEDRPAPGPGQLDGLGTDG
ncbi:hypothetical protein [Kitasatospora phosalacinea]|uniref:Uncharacterized protein n=1 Tax=Kitasatospora phosalacinea TaxID=2065 RepID=A0A9W6PFD9_9ACTN|nr:hypothetical protein [Kitasatospora phosalacinea]GLW53948.1 hypothetical protein Kpho01_19590 [Kitasatospora phosalacinea]